MTPTFTTWRKARRSGGGNDNCVEVAHADDASAVGVRDSKDTAGPVLTFAAGDWRSFTVGAKVGQFGP